MPREEFDAAMAGLASKIADEASADGLKLSERVDAFKALTPYYIGDSKLKKGVTEDDDDSTVKPFTFANARKNIEAVK